MYRQEHVGPGIARATNALAMRDVVVAVADQHGAHAGRLIDAPGEFARDLEHHGLLERAAVADRTWILAAMSGIDRDDDVARALLRRMYCRHDASRVRRGRRDGAELDEQPVTAVRGRGNARGARLVARGRLDDEPQRAPGLHPGAHGGDRPLGARQLHGVRQCRVGKIENDASRALEREQLEVGGRGQVDDHARTGTVGRGTHTVDTSTRAPGVIRHKGRGKQQQCGGHETAHGGLM